MILISLSIAFDPDYESLLTVSLYSVKHVLNVYVSFICMDTYAYMHIICIIQNIYYTEISNPPAGKLQTLDEGQAHPLIMTPRLCGGMVPLLSPYSTGNCVRVRE